MKKETKLKYYALLVGLFFFNQIDAQELHFSRLQDLSIWYNSSLSNGNQGSLRMNYRDVSLDNAIAYQTVAGLTEIPLNSKNANNRYWNLNLGLSTDKSNNGLLKNFQSLLGLSYTVPLSTNHTMSFGAQASYSDTRMDFTNSRFPDQYDSFGPIASAVSNDPTRNPNAKSWMSFHTGIALSMQQQNESWTLGVSIKDLTRPYINDKVDQEYRLSPTYGAQLRYSVSKGYTQFNFYAISNLKAKAFEQLVSASIRQQFSNNDLDALGFGMGYRLKDAVIPYVDLEFNRTVFAFHYEINISGIRSSGFRRNAFELGIRKTFGQTK